MIIPFNTTSAANGIPVLRMGATVVSTVFNLSNDWRPIKTRFSVGFSQSDSTYTLCVRKWGRTVTSEMKTMIRVRRRQHWRSHMPRARMGDLMAVMRSMLTITANLKVFPKLKFCKKNICDHTCAWGVWGGTNCLYLHAIRLRPKVGVYIPVTLKFWPGGGPAPPPRPRMFVTLLQLKVGLFFGLH